MIRTAVATGLFGLIVLFCSFPGLAHAQTVGSASNPNSFIPIDDTQQFIGQVVSAPSSGLTLQSFTLNIRRQTANLTVRPEVYEVTSIIGSVVNVAAAPVSSGAIQSVTSTNSAVFTFLPGVAVDPTKQYLIGVRREVAGQGGFVDASTTSTYVGGNLVSGNASPYSQSSFDLGFTATFSPALVTVPTLTEWAMILMGLALASAAVAVIGRRRVT